MRKRKSKNRGKEEAYTLLILYTVRLLRSLRTQLTTCNSTRATRIKMSGSQVTNLTWIMTHSHSRRSCGCTINATRRLNQTTSRSCSIPWFGFTVLTSPSSFDLLPFSISLLTNSKLPLLILTGSFRCLQTAYEFLGDGPVLYPQPCFSRCGSAEWDCYGRAHAQLRYDLCNHPRLTLVGWDQEKYVLYSPLSCLSRLPLVFLIYFMQDTNGINLVRLKAWWYRWKSPCSSPKRFSFQFSFSSSLCLSSCQYSSSARIL